MNLPETDEKIINFFKKISIPIARFSLFVVFFWFGILKVIGVSPAGSIVTDLYNQTIPFFPFHIFYISFAMLECLIGLLFLFKGFERIVIPFLFLHMFATFLPLFMLTDVTWAGFMIPTLEGQYIIKNLVIIATAIAIAAHLHPLEQKNK